MQELIFDKSRYVTTRLTHAYRRGELCAIGKDIFIQTGLIGHDGLQTGPVNPTTNSDLKTTVFKTEKGEIVAIHPDNCAKAIEVRANTLRDALLNGIQILCGPDFGHIVVLQEDSLRIISLPEP